MKQRHVLLSILTVMTVALLALGSLSVSAADKWIDFTETESNGSCELANVIDNNYRVTADLQNQYYSDFYTFVLPTDSTITIFGSSAYSKVDFVVRTESEYIHFYTNDTYSGGNYIVNETFTLPAGRYYLVVDSGDNYTKSKPYTFTFQYVRHHHLYENDCDATCGDCGAVREKMPHNYADRNDTTCDDCGTFCDHVVDTPCDPDCNLCGGAFEVKHAYSDICDTVCNLCGEEREVPHSFDNECDKQCNFCDFTREISHDFSGASCTEDNACRICGLVKEHELGHTYENDCDTICDRCQGGKRAPQHNYAAATCTAPKTCKVCGVTDGKKLGHSYESDCDTSCNRCKATRTVTHSYKTVTKKATPTADGYTVKQCSVCKNETGKKTLYKASKITLSKTAYTYNGKAQKPTVTVKDSKGGTVSSSHYTVAYATGRTNAGSYKVTVTMKGNYSGTKTLTFKINPQSATGAKVTAAKTVYAYNGKAQAPAVTVKLGSKTLKKNTDYTVKLPSARKNVGKYTVKVTFKGNYSGTKSVTYTIAPTAKETVTAVMGSTASIGAKSNGKITYTSSKKSVATVNSKGVITAVKAGTAVITVKSGSVTRKITVKVTNPSVKITAKSSSVNRGEKLQLTATANPASAKVTWSVSDKKIATISSKGVVTGKKAGVVTVTAKITYKGKTYKTTYKVQVKVASPDVSVFIQRKIEYTNIYAVSFTNNGNKSLKILSTGWVQAGKNAADAVGKLYATNGYCDSITVGAGKSVGYAYTLEKKLLFLSNTRVYCYVYFEYDGETYIAKCDSDLYGMQKCHTVTWLKG